MKSTVTFLIMFGLICLPAFTCTAAVVNVPTDQPTIQAGIDAAVDGDTVLVADGTYTGEGNWDIDFKGKAITVTSENGPEDCIIDCTVIYGPGHRGFHFHSNETKSSVLDGFTITKGITGIGGGIMIANSSPLIKNCVIKDCRATQGGGIYIVDSNCAIVQCSIQKNIATGVYPRGAGICIDNSDTEIIQCSIDGNNAYSGHHCQILGGGIIDCKNSSLLIEQSFIIKNFDQRHDSFGAFAFDHSSITVVNSIIAKNDTSGSWSFVTHSTMILINVVIADSKILTSSDHTTFEASDSNFTLVNCIVWDNDIRNLNRDDKTVDIRYSNIQGGWDGIGNINVDPLFADTKDPTSGYRLTPFSPCIDAGASENAPSTDIEGKPRFDGRVDMGAYEFGPAETTTYIRMPAHRIYPGDTVSCSVGVWNTKDNSPDDTKLFVVLELLGNYYFAPSFTSFDNYSQHFPIGLTKLLIIPEFIWPPGIEKQSGLTWYAALTNPQMTELWSNIAQFDFGWNE